MKPVHRLTLAALLSTSCSLHSLAYLQQGDSAGGADNAGGASGASGTSGAAGTSSAPGGAGLGGGSGTSGSAPIDAGAAGSAGSPARCDDQQLNGDETDLDCGGRICGACHDGMQCIKGSDCLSAICTNQACQAPSCNDLARNGDETDLNCGGSCPPCTLGHGCSINADCATSDCLDAVCVMPNCTGASPDAGCPLLLDNTPYTLHPVDAPTSCIDDGAFAMADGAGAGQYRCLDQINQAYWALAGANGYFSLRSALSGKCLQVRGNSLVANARIEQATCTGQPIQLFLPSKAAAGIKLTVLASGLSLDVLGSEDPTSGLPLIQSVDDGSLDMRWTATEAPQSAFLTLNALGQTGKLLSHDGKAVFAEASTGANAEWKVLPGLAETDCVSFESRDQPGAYLRHSQYLLWTDISDGSPVFALDATFCVRAPLSGAGSTYHSLESFNYPGFYIDAGDGRVKLAKFADTAEYRELSTWVLGQRK